MAGCVCHSYPVQKHLFIATAHGDGFCLQQGNNSQFGETHGVPTANGREGCTGCFEQPMKCTTNS